MVSKFQKKRLKLMEKYFYNLLLIYKQWLYMVINEKYDLKYVQSLFMIRLKPIIG